MYQLDGCDGMGEGYLALELDASLLNDKIENLKQALYSSQITTGQWNLLIQSVYIRPERIIQNHCLTLYLDMLEPSDIQHLH